MITVICPLCNKRIQVDNFLNSNICDCCKRVFITKEAKVVDEKTGFIKSDNNEYLYENIMELLNQGLDSSNSFLLDNYNKFKTNFPLDNRVDLCGFLIAYNDYKNSKDKTSIIVNKLINSLRKLNGTIYFNQYYELLMSDLNKTINSNNEMLYNKLLIENLYIDEFINSLISYSKDIEKFFSDVRIYEKDILSYCNNLNKYARSVINYLKRNDMVPPFDIYRVNVDIKRLESNDINDVRKHVKKLDSARLTLDLFKQRLESQKKTWRPIPFPVMPVCRMPVGVVEPMMDSRGTDYLANFNLFKDDGIDVEYLLNIYKKLSSVELDCLEINRVKVRIFDLFPDDVKAKLLEEERLILEEKNKIKKDRILIELNSYWGRYYSFLKCNDIKGAYNYLLSNLVKIENKRIYFTHEFNKFKKGLFKVKYLANVNDFNLDDVIMVSFENMNFDI